MKQIIYILTLVTFILLTGCDNFEKRFYHKIDQGHVNLQTITKHFKYDRKLTKITTILLILLVTSCKFQFTDRDLLIYNIYKVNDTLVFKNTLGDSDTFTISSKSIINKSWDENTGWYNPPIANVTFKDVPYNRYGRTVISWATTDTIIQDQSLLEIYKTRPNVEIDESIGFKGFFGTIDRHTQKTKDLDLKEFGDIFKVPSFDLTTVRDSTEITHIYWSDKFGIVAYDLKNGDKWKLTER